MKKHFFEIVNHKHDVLVVGAGGAGLRASIALKEKGLKAACITKVFPTRSHTVAAQGGISAALGNADEDNWQWHMYDTIKGGDWLGDQDAIAFLCKNAAEAIIELEHYGVPFSRSDDGKIYQIPYGGHTKNFGKAPAKRACAAEDKTGHAILHALYQQCLKHDVQFFVEFFVLDLLMDENKKCCGVISLELATGKIHIFQAHHVILATGGYGRVYETCTSAHICTGDGNAMALRAGLPLQDMEFVQFHPTGIYGVGCLITEGTRGLGAILLNGNGERFMTRYAPQAKDLASRDVVSRAMMLEIREGRGCGENKDHLLLDLSNLSDETIEKQLSGITEIAKTFAGIDVRKEPVPVLPTAHFNMGGVPSNYRGEVFASKSNNGVNDDALCEGLSVIGEAACTSVHGANRLGCNSLADLIVFGKAAAIRVTEIIKPKTPHQELHDNAGKETIEKLQALLSSSGGKSVSKLRKKMQNTMQNNCGVFRNAEILQDGVSKIEEIAIAAKDISLVDSSLIWNTELIEALEFKNLLLQARATLHSAFSRQESRGAHAREDFPERDDKNYMNHTICFYKDEKIHLGKRSVRTDTLIKGVEYFPPEKRVY